MENSLTALIDTLMGNIKGMVNVNTVVGDAMTAPDGTIIIPISKVSFGIGAGGTEFEQKKSTPTEQRPMFGGGGGGGAAVSPTAFMVIANGNVRILPLGGGGGTPLDKLVDLAPELFDKVADVISKNSKKNKNNEDEEQSNVEE